MQESEKKETTTPKPLLGKEGRRNISPPTESRSVPFRKGDTTPALSARSSGTGGADSGTPPAPFGGRAGPFTKDDFNAWQLAWELGYTIAIPIVIFALLGRWADKAWGTSPWLLLAGIVISIMISSFAVYKKVGKILK